MPKKDVVAVHHADRRRDVTMPYAPALLVRRGSLVFLSGVTAAPVYHSHPHREEEFDLPDDHARAGRARDGQPREDARGGGLRARRPRLRHALSHRCREQDDLNRVWASYLGDHLPTTTTVEVSRLATHPSCKVEISAIAVADAAPTRARRARAAIAVTPSRARAARRAPGKPRPRRS